MVQPEDEGPPAAPPPSYGNMSEQHWSRARRGMNEEALAYYRERSQAPGVAEGGAERNFYCMSCAGVIPHRPALSACPHCGAALDEAARRYFNWVEINEPPASDARPLLALAGLVGAVVVVLGLAAWLLWIR